MNESLPSYHKDNPERRLIERTAHSSGLLAGAYRQRLEAEGMQGTKLLDVGAGDSDFYSYAKKHNDQDVVRLDTDYDYQVPEGAQWIAGDICQYNDQLADEEFDTVMASFVMQHLDAAQKTAALQQMLRVVRVDGAVGLFPVYKPKLIKDLIKANSRAMMLTAHSPDYSDELSINDKKLARYQTLWIGKVAADQPKVIEAIAGSGALDRRITRQDVRRRMAMRAMGSNIVNWS